MTRLRELGGLGTLALALLLLPATPATAQEQGPVRLSADRAEVDNRSGTSVYRGDVVLTRGPARITGEVMWVYTNEQRELERVEVEGEPATYRQQPEGDGQLVEAEAPRMEYYASGPERVLLLQGGRLWQGENQVRGETITYFVADERVEAERGADGDDRIEVTVFPEREEGG
ncbi:lipopolysaccharide transport periplasmic protein LptA [Sediminicurvatus halobius]|uniref:Lipopolysaccharide export system protein LptA n=1 Tax=Sediminicurvatus halobius TaxID=2182432 RepID=A0A2U2N7N9_9GAMM|nr:lipopolysaccharide transport periplasmic protein LptA [Spiribacter halobius]PWG65205.1 lipopolysaccharide transport periplasmic protein LptA [Spiribacter halobius]UEX78841.1 lipopolysaccharide transport periplasmic protein LptA [Spiribacter halobius]